MAPLSRAAIANYVVQAELDKNLDHDRIYDLTKGHPLAARYLIEALKAAYTKDRRDRILEYEFNYEGDIKRIYDAAHREVERSSDVQKVLAYVARAEGPIHPKLIATLIDPEAVEAAYKASKHLLAIEDGRWRIFHNSFRIYLLDKTPLRFGNPDPEYTSELYRGLASLAAAAVGNDPQRWLELRYRSRAGENNAVVPLATAERFRQQLAEGRSPQDIAADIRLAFRSLVGGDDLPSLVRLLLARHEISRRAEALYNAENIIGAYIALGDLDVAQSFVGEYAASARAYEVVDALVTRGRIEEARRLFERVEPLSRSTDYSIQEDNLREWAGRVHLFREADQICRIIPNLTRPRTDNSFENERLDRLRWDLKFEVARAAITAAPDADIALILEKLDLGLDASRYLQLEAASAAYSAGNASLAAERMQAFSSPSIGAEVPTGWLRRATALAVKLGDLETAARLFRSLKPPSMAEEDQGTPGQTVGPLSAAIIEHYMLAAVLGVTAVLPEQPEHRSFLIFQEHLITLGNLLGRGRRGRVLPSAAVVDIIRKFLAFLNNVKPTRGTEAYRIAQIHASAAIIIKSMLRAGRLHGAKAYAAVLTEVDRAMTSGGGNLRFRLDVRQNVALTAFEFDADLLAATARLEGALKDLEHESTPENQVSAIAGFAKAFAAIGQEARVRELLSCIHDDTFGYAQAPKRDSQYLFWRDVFKHSCEADATGRASRVAFMLRLVKGMMHTEGRASAYRLTAALLEQAAMEGPSVAAAVAAELEHAGLVSWDGLLDNLLRGLVSRRPDLAMSAIQLWVRLVMPFYEEPHYQESRLGGFMSHTLAIVSASEISPAVEVLRAAIKAESSEDKRIRFFNLSSRSGRC
jgi:hypothetical protein